jgi:desulfoferrodoxin (superoxide reductase-like protein)
MKLRIPRRIKAETPIEEDSEQSDDSQDKDKVPVTTTKTSTTVSAKVTQSGVIHRAKQKQKHPRQVKIFFKVDIVLRKITKSATGKSTAEGQQ